MEEVISFLSHVCGAILFCIALTLLLMIGSMEEQAMTELTNSAASAFWYVVP